MAKKNKYARYLNLFEKDDYANEFRQVLMKTHEQSFIHLVDEMMDIIRLDEQRGYEDSRENLRIMFQNAATVHGASHVLIKPAIKKAVELVRAGVRGYVEQRIIEKTYPSDPHWTGD